MLEYGTEDHVLHHCAQNSSKFLEAVLVAVKFLSKRGTGDPKYESQEAIDVVAETCSDIAGGNQFLDFYKMMLGSET